MSVKQSSPEINACKAIIKSLFGTSYKHLAWVFYEPLDAQMLALYDYHEIVKEPMDLSTVRHRISSGCYQNAADFAKDVRLIFYNTYLYTKPGHLCYEMAKKLQVVFEEMFAQVAANPGAPGTSCYSDTEESSSSSSSSSSSEDDSDSEESGTSSSSEASQATSSSTAPPPAPVPEWAKTGMSSFTTEEDLDLHAKIQQLDGEVLLHVIHLIQRGEGGGYGNKELEFDVCQLKVHTKRSILEYLESRGINGKRQARSRPKYN
ncbi:bromodomain-containing protein 2 [Drosophila bipectinata]|uniref:bromodomain-containing protein 2 n=1 Tax=Drosophila bipectinata TaxID=42026 RepID=UPI001C8A3531|nr:bromodomain-containing protein 2 [Drosophila bipectinata]